MYCRGSREARLPNQRAKALRLRLRDDLGGVGEQSSLGPSQDVAEEALGVPLRGVDSRGCEDPGRLGDEGGGGHWGSAQAADVALSFAAWWWASRLPTISSRSPSRISCRRWMVRPMRWSVTRACWKL